MTSDQPDIAAVPWRERQDGDHPGGLHALLLGVSWYDRGDEHGLDSLPGAAMSAARFASWLDRTYRNLAAPLRSIRILTSAVDQEDEEVAAELGVLPPDADRANVVTALGAWAADCDSHADNIALLYAAGHGCYTELDGGFVLLQGYGTSADLLDDSLNIRRVVDGLAGLQAHGTFMFVDACLTPPPKGTPYDITSGVKLPPPGPGPSHRSVLKQYFAAAPGMSAWVLPDEHSTAFGSALMRALEGAALETHPDGMVVKADGLLQEIKAGVRACAPDRREEYVAQIVPGTPSPATADNPVFHIPERLDPIGVTIRLDPRSAARVAQGELYRRAEFDRDIAFDRHPVELSLIPDYYSLRVASPPPPAFKKVNPGTTLKLGYEDWQVEVPYAPG